MDTYRIENLDCANCAAKIEQHLNQMTEVSFASVNFATSTLAIDTSNFEKVREAINSIEPDIYLLPHGDDPNSGDGKDQSKREIFRIVLATLLFMAGIVFNDRLRNTPNGIAEYIVLLPAYFISGWTVLMSAFRNIRRGQVFDENFLMTVATVGAILINELPEAVGVMLFYMFGEYLQNLSIGRSRRSIKALMEIKPDYANLIANGKTIRVPPEAVKVGDVIQVNPGERVPLDAEVLEGTSAVDPSALTGESIPKAISPGDPVLAGMVNQHAMIYAKVLKPFEQSSISRIMNLVENAANRKAVTEKFITRFARYYSPVVVFFALGVAIIPPLIIPGAQFSDWIYRALVVLVISCPCALVVSIPLGYFGGVGGASKQGVLVKGSNYLDILATVKTVIFDKTGTLTRGVFKVVDVVSKNGKSPDEILYWTSLAESQSRHPIAQSILDAYGKTVETGKLDSYEEIAGHGIRVRTNGDEILVGSDALLHRQGISHPTCTIPGTVIHLAVNKEYHGYLVISDEMRSDAHEAIRQLRRQGVNKILMLTGDSAVTAEKIAGELDLDGFRAGLLPEDKVTEMESLLSSNSYQGKTAFVGDGINDAPALARADVGIAMGAIGSDAAIETADVVLMTDSPLKVAEAIRISRHTRRIVWQNIILALTVKGAFIAFGISGMASMWEAVFADMGVALLAILNSTRVYHQEKS